MNCTVVTLKTIPIFSELNQEELLRVQEIAIKRTYKKDVSHRLVEILVR